MCAADLPLSYNAAVVLEHNLETRADKVALLSPDRELTFREVADEANRVGNALTKLGIEFVDDLPKTATGKIQRFKLR
jgi:acyl-coenzyme A synthetase/AMP-(fatty) acid ligase